MENLTVEEFNQQFRQWHGKSIVITKEEKNDIDKLIIQLDDSGYEKRTRKIDDYVPTYTLHLHGAGTVHTDDDMQPIPDDQYDIPLDDDTIYQYDGNAFHLQTFRGKYRLEIADGPVS